MPADQLFGVAVVGHDTGDLDRQGAGAAARQQVGQTVIVLRDHDHSAGSDGGVPELPVHREGLGNRAEGVTQVLQAAVRLLDVGGQAQEEVGAVGVQILLGFDDVATTLGDEGGHRRDDATPIGATEREYQTLV